MPVAAPPLPAAFRVGGRPVLGFLIHRYDLFDLGETELVFGPPCTSKQLGVRRPFVDAVEAAMNGLFGDVVPALTSLEVCLPEALPDDLLEGKRAGGRNAFTAFHTRGVRVVVTFSPKLGTRELTCLGEPTWRCWPADSAHWYSIGLLRPWFSESLPPDECERRITAHFEAGAHREYREPNKTDPRRWQLDDGSAVPLGGKTRLPGSAWRIWGLRGYRLLPDGGAHGRDGSLVPEASLAQIAKEELLPWPGAALDWRPSEADAECWFRPLDEETTAALLRLQADLRAQPARPQGQQGQQGQQGGVLGGRKTDTRVRRVVWHLAPTGPRAMVVVGHASWGGGNDKSGLRLKALPTAGELAGPCAALPPLPEAEQLTADVIAPVSHVLAFNALLDVAWCKPSPPPSGLAAGAETVASSSAGGSDPLVPVACGVPVGEGRAVSNALARDGPLPRYAAAVPADAGADTLERAAARQAERLQFAEEGRAEQLKYDEAWLAERVPSAEDLARSAQRAAGPAGSSCTGEPSVCQSLARRLGAHIQADPFANPLLNASTEELERTDAAWGRLCDDDTVWMEPVILRLVEAAPEGRKAGVSQELRGMQLDLARTETRPAPPHLRQLAQAMYPCKDDLAACRAWDAHFRSGVPYGMIDVVGRLLAATLELLCREEREAEDAERLVERDPAFVAAQRGRGGEAARVVNKPAETPRLTAANKVAEMRELTAGLPVPAPVEGVGALGKRRAVPCDVGAGAKRQRPGAGESARSLPPSEVPGRRAEVLEGLRRVLRFVDQSPEEFWLKHGPAGPFPFPEQLAALRAELAGPFQGGAPSHGRV